MFETTRSQQGRRLLKSFPMSVQDAMELTGRSEPVMQKIFRQLAATGALSVTRSRDEPRRFVYHLQNESIFRRVMEMPPTERDDLPEGSYERLAALIRRRDEIDREIRAMVDDAAHVK